MVPFLEEWIKYYEQMVGSDSYKDLGRNLSPIERGFLSEDQVSSLNSLKEVSKDQMIQGKIAQATNQTGGTDPLKKD